MTELAERYKEVDPQQIEKRAKKIRAIRYKVYMFICIVFIIFFWPVFIKTVDKVRGTDAFVPKNLLNMPLSQALFTNRGDGGLLNSIDGADRDIASKEREIAQARVIQEILSELDNEGKQYALANCLNYDECDDIDDALLRNADLLRAYIILDELHAEKMSFDQKTLLKSINEFILDFSTESDDGVYSPELLSVDFGNPSLVDPKYKLYQVRVELTLEIPTKDVLIEFMEKVEKEVSFKYPVLFAIRELNYNIMEYGFSQRVSVTLNAYYYQGANKPKKEEQPELEENSTGGGTGSGQLISGRPTVGQVNSGAQDTGGQDALPSINFDTDSGVDLRPMGGIGNDQADSVGTADSNTDTGDLSL